jgi:hypothetical protein
VRGWLEMDIIGAQPWSLAGGVEHMIECLLDPSKKLVTTGEHARHVLEIMDQAIIAARKKRTIDLKTTF